MMIMAFAACGGGDDGGGSSSGGGEQVSNKLLRVTESVEILPAGGEKTIQVTARNCSWTIEKESSASWLSVTPLNGNGSQTITLTAARNDSNNKRQATLTIKENNGQLTCHTTVIQDYDRPDPNEGIPQAEDNTPLTPPWTRGRIHAHAPSPIHGKGWNRKGRKWKKQRGTEKPSPFGVGMLFVYITDVILG